MPGVLEQQGEDVDLWWWQEWRCLGERERRGRGLGVEDGYGRRGERDGEVDMGRRWRAWWRPGEREWWWRWLGVVDGYGRRGERGAWLGLWREGEVDVGRRWRAWRRRAELERWWGGLGVGVLYGRRGEGEVDMGRRWRSCWHPGEQERRERGLGGLWWHLGEWERWEWVVDARWRCGECGRRGRVCRAGGEGERRRLRDQDSSLESGQSGRVSGSWGASRGAAWYWGGGGPLSSMDPPRRGVVAAAAGGMGRVTVLGGVGPGGPLRRGHGGRGDTDTVPGMRGVAGTGGPAFGGSWGMRVERSVAAIPFAGAVRAPGVVVRRVGWWAVVVVGVVLVVLLVELLVVLVFVVVGLVLRVWPMDPLWVFWSPLCGWGVGHRGQPLGLHYVVVRGGGLGAGFDSDSGRGVPRPWVGLAGGGGGLRGMDKTETGPQV